MLSIAKLTAGSSASIEKYMRGEMENGKSEDYYSSEQSGKWVGGLAHDLDLKGEVKNGELTAILNGYNPATGEILASNFSKENRVPGHDSTFSAPKSVSLEWAFNPSARADIEQAQQRAVEKALHYLAENGIRNRDRTGEHAGKPVGKLIAATYQHGSSREGDPQLHTHCAIANIAQRPDGTYGGTDLDMRYKMAAGAAYRAELANELKSLGYQIERDGTSFRLAGADKAQEEEFSKRSAQIRAQALETGKTSHLQKMDVTRDSRKAKELTPSELRDSWDKAAMEINYQPVPRESFNSEKNEGMPPPQEFVSRLCQQQSTVSEAQLQSAVLVEAQGKLSADGALKYLNEVKAHAETISLTADKVHGRGHDATESRYTSREMYELEKGIGDRAITMQADRASVGGRAVAADCIAAAMSRKTLSDEQQAALKHIAGEGRIAVVQGTAGAGKSYMLDAARDAWESDGRQVIGCALSGKAAEGLQESAGIPSDTIHSTLGKLDRGEIVLNSKTVIVMDEAGMTGSRLMADLQSQIDAAGGKLVLVGDVRQLQPVDAGGAMRQIQSKTGYAQMEDIRRQKDSAEQQMVHDFKDGRADKALNYLESKDRLKGYDTVTAARAAAASAVVSDLAIGKTSISMSDTRAACKEMNQAAREKMREAGMLKSADVSFKSEISEGNHENKQFAVGDRVIFLKNERKELGVKNGTTGTITNARDGVLTVKIDGKDKEITVDQAKYAKLDHGYAFTVHKSQGVTVDRAHYAPGQMANRELGYVAGSRHREEFTLHSEKSRLADLRETLGKSQAKGTSQDYRRDDPHIVKPANVKPLLRESLKLDTIKQASRDLANGAMDRYRKSRDLIRDLAKPLIDSAKNKIEQINNKPQHLPEPPGLSKRNKSNDKGFEI